ncbi:hypothetical protein LV75_000592 [Actinokineospora diospyrosa]|uniref:Uncharacterized protein n=1 Tax=Actinokineospora diospyrosa TaxID=103728 RepID=A0ABT1I663_9PSEU|nr:hypothetical protein [Actinokineospora diospyrosa]
MAARVRAAGNCFLAGKRTGASFPRGAAKVAAVIIGRTGHSGPRRELCPRGQNSRRTTGLAQSRRTGVRRTRTPKTMPSRTIAAPRPRCSQLSALLIGMKFAAPSWSMSIP